MDGAPRIRVFLCDDHAILRAGLRALLEREADMEVVGEAGTVAEAVERVRDLRPDVVVMDIRLPDGDGLEAVPRLLEASPPSRVLILTMYAQPYYLLRAMRVGASGYVLKSDVDTELVRAIRIAHAGEPFLYSTEAYALFRAYLANGGDPNAPSLSPMEAKVLRLTAEGLTAREIGEALHISPNTVDTYRRRVMGKLGLARRADLVAWALRHGYLDGPKNRGTEPAPDHP